MVRLQKLHVENAHIRNNIHIYLGVVLHWNREQYEHKNCSQRVAPIHSLNIGVPICQSELIKTSRAGHLHVQRHSHVADWRRATSKKLWWIPSSTVSPFDNSNAIWCPFEYFLYANHARDPLKENKKVANPNYLIYCNNSPHSHVYLPECLRVFVAVRPKETDFRQNIFCYNNK